MFGHRGIFIALSLVLDNSAGSSNEVPYAQPTRLRTNTRISSPSEDQTAGLSRLLISTLLDSESWVRLDCRK